MYIDKSRSKRSQWRIRENTLIIIAIFGGSIGSYLGMKNFRHKTKHSKFKYGIPFIIFIQIVIIFLIYNKDIL
ncbi:phosphoesterase [Clostridium putrefaciens]|uniref:Phosphoesterase n=2 Tax=Clostridium putrefaciens TaxID=99675 RepID=A0A381JAY3_9CLOT|nr:phosphoesterase [Clostridium putrefaciens]